MGPHIGRYCGQTSPGRVTSYTGILSMTITTDSAIAKEGFSASYTIRERSLPHEDEGEEPGGRGGSRVSWSVRRRTHTGGGGGGVVLPLIYPEKYA